MGEPPESEDERGTSPSPPHADQRSEVHDAYGVHPDGQTGLAVGPLSLPQAPTSAGEGDEQSPGPATEGVLGGAADPVVASTRPGGRAQVTAIPPGATELPMRHHRVAAGGSVAGRDPPHHSQAC